MSISERTEQVRPSAGAGETLLEIKDLRIEGQSDERWHAIVKGVDLTLRRGEVLGLIGESGAGKSTIGSPRWVTRGRAAGSPAAACGSTEWICSRSARRSGARSG